MAVKTKKRLQIFKESITLKTIEEIDEFIKKVVQETEGWFDPESLWEVENPYDVFRRLDELGLKVYTYKKKDAKSLDMSIPINIANILEEDDYISVCQYNKDNKDDNFLQDLFLSHWTDRKCYFSKAGPYNVCFICNKDRTVKIFSGSYIVKIGLNNPYFISMTKEDLEKSYRRIC